MLLLAALLALQDADALVRQLGSDEPAVREQASADLDKLGAAALQALDKAASSADTEVASRASALRNRIRSRIRIDGLKTARVERIDNPFWGYGRADHFQVTRDGTRAVGANLSHVWVWSVPEGRLLHTWMPHATGDVRNHVLSPDGTRLLTVGDTFEELAIWSFPDVKLLRRFDAVSRMPAVAVPLRDGKSFICGVGSRLHRVDTATGRVLWTSRFDVMAYVHSIDVCRDGKRVAAIGMNIDTARVMDASTGATLAEFRVGTTSRIRFTADGEAVAVWDRFTDAELFNLKGESLRKVPYEARHTLLGRELRFAVRAPSDARPAVDATLLRLPVDDSEDETLLLGADRAIVRTINNRLYRFDAKKGGDALELATGASASTVTDTHIVVGFANGDVAFLDADGKTVHRGRHGQSGVARVVSLGGTTILSTGEDHVVRCWDVATNRELWRREHLAFEFYTHVFTPDNRCVIGHVGSELTRWDAETGRTVRTYARIGGYLAGVAVSADGKTVAASTRDGPLAAWDVESGRRLWEHSPGKNARWLAFTPDGKSLLVGDDDGRVARHSTATGEPDVVVREKGARVSAGVLSPDGRLAAVLSDAAGPAIFDVSTGKIVRELNERITGGAAFLNDNRDFLYAAPATLVKVATGERVFQARYGSVLAAAVDATRTRLGVLTTGDRVLVCDLTRGRVVWEFDAGRTYGGLVLAPEAKHMFLYSQGSAQASAEFGAKKARLHREGQEAWIRGADASKGRVITLGRAGLELRDIGTFEVAETRPDVDAHWVWIPPGSSRAYGWKGDVVRPLRSDTFAPEDPWPDKLDWGTTLDVSPDGLAFLSGLNIYDAQGRRSGRLPWHDPYDREGGPVAAFFAADGESVIVVQSNGLVTHMKAGR